MTRVSFKKNGVLSALILLGTACTALPGGTGGSGPRPDVPAFVPPDMVVDSLRTVAPARPSFEAISSGLRTVAPLQSTELPVLHGPKSNPSSVIEAEISPLPEYGSSPAPSFNTRLATVSIALGGAEAALADSLAWAREWNPLARVTRVHVEGRNENRDCEQVVVVARSPDGTSMIIVDRVQDEGRLWVTEDLPPIPVGWVQSGNFTRFSEVADGPARASAGPQRTHVGSREQQSHFRGTRFAGYGAQRGYQAACAEPSRPGIVWFHDA